MKSDLEQSVIAVENKLATLDQLTVRQAELEATISELRQDEQFILAGEEKRRVKKLLEARAKLDVAEADLSKAKAEYFSCRQEVIGLAISAHDSLCAWREQIIETRSSIIRTELEKLFDKQVMTEVGRFVRFSRPVSELDVVRLVFVSSKPELGLSNARKLRAILSDLEAAAENKPLPSFASPAGDESPES